MPLHTIDQNVMDPAEKPSILEILLADDEPAITEEVGDTLREQGHHVTTVSDGANALSYLSSRVFDLVISDVRLPAVDRYDPAVLDQRDHRVLRIASFVTWSATWLPVANHAPRCSRSCSRRK